MNKLFAFSILAFGSCVAYAYPDPYKASETVGCGVVTSIRNTSQTPLLNREYLVRFAPRSGEPSGTVMQVADGLGVGLLVNATIGAVVEGVSNKATERKVWPAVTVQDQERVAGLIAMTLTMDDGRVLNIPVTTLDFLTPGHSFKVGQRLSLSYSKAAGALQFAPKKIKVPEPASDAYEQVCGLRVPKEEADRVLAEAMNLVDESKIKK